MMMRDQYRADDIPACAATIGSIITRAQAKAAGLTYYFTGAPCKNGRIAKRQTSNCTCKCDLCQVRQRQSGSQWKKRNPDKVKAAMAAWNATPAARQAVAEWGRTKKHMRNAITARRHAKKCRATPTWVEYDLIAEVYRQAALRSWHVDHVVPLNSEIVCGLHCWANLQLLSPSENCSKGNFHWPDMP